MSRHQLFLSSKLFWAASVFLVLISIALTFAWWLKIWSYEDYFSYRAMTMHCHPVTRDLVWRKIRAGDSLSIVIEQTNPVSISRNGDFTVLHYQEGLSCTGVGIIAEKGRLIEASAWGCTWERVFFDQLDDRRLPDSEWEKVDIGEFIDSRM